MMFLALLLVLLAAAGLALVLDVFHDGLGRRPGPRSHVDSAADLHRRLL